MPWHPGFPVLAGCMFDSNDWLIHGPLASYPGQLMGLNAVTAPKQGAVLVPHNMQEVTGEESESFTSLCHSPAYVQCVGHLPECPVGTRVLEQNDHTPCSSVDEQCKLHHTHLPKPSRPAIMSTYKVAFSRQLVYLEKASLLRCDLACMHIHATC